MDQLGGDTCITRRENPAFSDVGFRRREGRMATEEAAAPAAPPAEEAPPAVPAEAGAAAGEQEEKVEEEQEPAEVLPPPCFDLDEHKLKVCSRYTIQYSFWLFHHQATSQSQSPASSGKVFPLCVLFPPVSAFHLCLLFPVCAFPCVCFFQNAKGNSIYWAL